MPATILVADDDRAIRTVLNQALVRLGHDVRLTGNAATLWRWITDGEGDLVITDIIMPEKEGIQTITEIRREQPEAKVIAISGGGRIGNTDFLRIAQKLGATEVIAKPFDPDDLRSRVARCLAGH